MKRRSILGAHGGVRPVRLSLSELGLDCQPKEPGRVHRKLKFTKEESSQPAKKGPYVPRSLVLPQQVNATTSEPLDNTINLPQSSRGSTKIAVKKDDSLKASVGASKIPRCSNSGIKKQSQGSLDSTAVFEEVEVATLTSTPHPLQKLINTESWQEASEVGEQFKGLIAEHRSLMQVMKLSFQKMNTLMESQTKVNLAVVEMIQEMKGRVLSNDSGTQLSDISNFENPSSLNFSNHHNMTKKILTPVLEEGKENTREVPSRKSLSMYLGMKSEINCLKTPLAKTTKPKASETPNTVLSNTVQHQLEELFETSQTDGNE